MKRLPRWTFGSLLVSAIIIAIAASGLWIRSHTTCDYLWLNRTHPKPHHSSYPIDRPSGTFFLEFTQTSASYPRDYTIEQMQHWDDEIKPGMWTLVIASGEHMHGYHFDYENVQEHKGIASQYLFIWFPFWVVILVCFSMALLSLLKLRHRPQTGHCRRCGYDLRATPRRCPECGDVARS